MFASDADVGINAQIEFSIRSGGDGKFSIDPSTGIVSTVGALNPLDRENVSFYLLQIVASDMGRPVLSSSVFMEVTILDVNDNAPIFTQGVFNFAVVENSPVNTVAGLVSATDLDIGINAVISYSIVGGNMDNAWAINAVTGQIYLNGSVNRDPPTGTATYYLSVAATDNGNPRLQSLQFAQAVISIGDVNDNAPTFDQAGYFGQVPENSPIGTPVVLTTPFTCTDNDAGMNAQLSYTLVGGDGYFTISPQGIVSVLRSADREVRSVYVMTLIGTFCVCGVCVCVCVCVCSLRCF